RRRRSARRDGLRHRRRRRVNLSSSGLRATVIARKSSRRASRAESWRPLAGPLFYSSPFSTKPYLCTMSYGCHVGSPERHISRFRMEPVMRLPFALIRAVVQIAIAQIVPVSPAAAQTQPARPHNVVLFIADGLRFRMVDDHLAPTMAAIARDGVSLRNGHALFPTFTMANASGMATGHLLGDTGTFSNTIYTGFEVPGAGNSLTPLS